MDVVTFLKKRKELIFSLNLSNVFRDLKTYCNWRTADSYSFIIGTILYCAIEPLAILPIVLYFTFLSQFFPFPVRRRESMFVVFANRSAIFSLATIPAFVVSIIRMGGLSYNALQIYDPLSFMPLSFMPLSFMNIRIFLFAFLLLIPWYLIIFNCSEVIVWLKTRTLKDIAVAVGILIAYAAFMLLLLLFGEWMQLFFLPLIG